MSAVALVGPHIQAAGYTRGRAFREAKTVRWLVVHSAEGGSSEIVLGNYFHGTTRGSSNCGIGQLGGYATYVGYNDTPWTNPPTSQESDTVELLAFAKWTRAEWLSKPKMLDTLARWLAWRAAVRGIPIVLLSAADLRAGKSGICDHATVNAVYHQSAHWDVGHYFPWDLVIPKARIYAGVTPPPPIEEDPLSAFSIQDLRDAAGVGVTTQEVGSQKIETGQRLTYGIAAQRLYNGETPAQAALAAEVRAIGDAVGALAEAVAALTPPAPPT